MIAGVAWDIGGAWPSYALGFAWGAALTVALLRNPEAPIAGGDGDHSLGVREPRSIGSAAGQHLHHPLISTGSIRLGSLFLTLPTRGLTGQHVISPKRRARVTSQSRSFDDLVGAAKDRGWDFNPNRARGFEVDH
jgi:hypothetical protein